MRILDSGNNQIVDSIEICLTEIEFDDFYFRLNDLAFNPDYKPEDTINDVIMEDSEKTNIKYSIEIAKYTASNYINLNNKIKKIIDHDTI